MAEPSPEYKCNEPYKFEGYNELAYTSVPDEFFDWQYQALSLAELKVLLYIFRRTFGFKKHQDHIALSQFLDGISKKDGEKLDNGCGLSKNSITEGIKGLLDKGYICCQFYCPRCNRPVEPDEMMQEVRKGKDRAYSVSVVPRTCPRCQSPLYGQEERWFSLVMKHDKAHIPSTLPIQWDTPFPPTDNPPSHLLTTQDTVSRNSIQETDYPSDAKNASEGNEFFSPPQPQSVTESITNPTQNTMSEFDGGLRYVECDDDGVPFEDTPQYQRIASAKPRKGDPDEMRFLGTVNALNWRTGTALKGRAIIASYHRGLKMEHTMGLVRVYQACFDEVVKCHEHHLPSPPLVFPATWWEDRLMNAQKHGWALTVGKGEASKKAGKRNGLIENFLLRDSLLEHCQRQLNLLGVKRDVSAAEQSSDGIIRMGDGKEPLPPDGIYRM